MIARRRRSVVCGSLMALSAAGVLGLTSGRASAQPVGGAQARSVVPQAEGVLTALRPTLSIQRLRGAQPDTTFDWDLDLALDIDVFDFGWGRANVFGNFESIIGSTTRTIDPNQVAYTADLSMFFRLPRGELAATFHHVSRHLVDRAHTDSVAWNMIGAAYAERLTIGEVTVDAGVRGMGTVQRQSVDYLAQFEAHVDAAWPVGPSVSVIVGGRAVVVPVKQEKFDRSNRNGGRVEGGIRWLGQAATLDLFVAWERRIDASPIARDTANWAQAGLRLTTTIP